MVVTTVAAAADLTYTTACCPKSLTWFTCLLHKTDARRPRRRRLNHGRIPSRCFLLRRAAFTFSQARKYLLSLSLSLSHSHPFFVFSHPVYPSLYHHLSLSLSVSLCLCLSFSFSNCFPMFLRPPYFPLYFPPTFAQRSPRNSPSLSRGSHR